MARVKSAVENGAFRTERLGAAKRLWHLSGLKSDEFSLPDARYIAEMVLGDNWAYLEPGVAGSLLCDVETVRFLAEVVLA